MTNRTADPSWYDSIVNILAAVLVLLIWRAFAWAAIHWHLMTGTEDTAFVWIVAASVAVHLHKVRERP